jgi:mannan endo-1,4-beta-mannosidase
MPHSPVNPNANKEARELLDFFYKISGHQILSGQHNQPVHGSMWTETIERAVGKTPAFWGQEIGFSASGTLDGVNFRKQNLEQAKARHVLGNVISLTWHQTAPDQDEPVDFFGGIIRDLTPEQRKEILRDGFPLNKALKKRWDLAADMLNELQGFGIPIVHRPFHEMNGPWFWWSGNGSDRGEFFKALWKMQFKYFTEEKKLNNLLWCFSPNMVSDNTFGYPGKIEDFNPGQEFVDLYAIDIYDGNYTDEQYRLICNAAGDKPIGVGECAELLTPEQMEKFPRYCWYMAWADLVITKNTKQQVTDTMSSHRVINLEDMSKFRQTW